VRDRVPHVSFLQEANKALRAIAAVSRRGEAERIAATAPPDAAGPERARIVARLQQLAEGAKDKVALSEALSKEVLRAYGIATPAEALATDAMEAVAAADHLTYPVVLKAVSPKLLHKTEMGAVALNLRTAAEVADAYGRITDNLARRGFTEPLDGMLVCRQIAGGLELALGLHRDPEMGIVVMAGSGGILLELVKDVAFCAPPVSRDKARDLLARTRAGEMLAGYRGGAKRDVDSVIDALVGLGRLATDLAELVDAVDINPFAVLPDGQGGVALDALIILRPRQSR
jgi:acyl-CoA synthetase (NDP forming)